MAALNFPSSPALNDTYTANGITYTWNGTAWINSTYAITLNNDSSTNTSQYVLMSRTSSGGLSNAYVDNTALSYNPSTGLLNLDSNTILQLTSYRETSTTPTISAGTLTLNLANSNIFNVTLNAAITTLTISNIAASGKVSSFILVFTANGTAYSVTWPGSFKWPGGTAPTLTTTNNKRDIITAFTSDAGTTWFAFISGQNL